MKLLVRKPAHTVAELASARQHQKTGRPTWCARWRVRFFFVAKFCYLHRVPVGQGPAPGTLGSSWLAGHFPTAVGFWSGRAGACYWHGVGGFMLTSSSSAPASRCSYCSPEASGRSGRTRGDVETRRRDAEAPRATPRQTQNPPPPHHLSQPNNNRRARRSFPLRCSARAHSSVARLELPCAAPSQTVGAVRRHRERLHVPLEPEAAARDADVAVDAFQRAHLTAMPSSSSPPSHYHHRTRDRHTRSVVVKNRGHASRNAGERDNSARARARAVVRHLTSPCCSAMWFACS